MTTDAPPDVETLASEYLEALAAERHLLSERYRQGRRAGELPPILEAIDRTSKTRRRAFLRLLEVRIGVVEVEDPGRADTIIRAALERGKAMRVEAAETEAAGMRATG